MPPRRKRAPAHHKNYVPSETIKKVVKKKVLSEKINGSSNISSSTRTPSPELEHVEDTYINLHPPEDQDIEGEDAPALNVIPDDDLDEEIK